MNSIFTAVRTWDFIQYVRHWNTEGPILRNPKMPDSNGVCFWNFYAMSAVTFRKQEPYGRGTSSRCLSSSHARMGSMSQSLCPTQEPLLTNVNRSWVYEACELKITGCPSTTGSISIMNGWLVGLFSLHLTHSQKHFILSLSSILILIRWCNERLCFVSRLLMPTHKNGMSFWTETDLKKGGHFLCTVAWSGVFTFHKDISREAARRHYQININRKFVIRL